MSSKSLNNYYKSKEDQDTPAILIIIGLLLIFVIGYVFWSKIEKEKKQIDTSSDMLHADKDQIKKKIDQCKLDNEKANSILALKKVKRSNYFMYARLLLVIIALGFFFLLQNYLNFSPYKNQHIVDNLRNYLSFIVIVFTTIAFVAKGNLKDFKESITDMATNWFFKDEQSLELEIQSRELLITSLSNQLLIIETNGQLESCKRAI